MAKIITTIAAENGMSFDDIMAFETVSYIGLWSYSDDAFVVMSKCEKEFSPWTMLNYMDLKSLDDAIFAELEEHIEYVYDDSVSYTITLIK